MILVYILTAVVMAFSLLIQSNTAFDVIRIFGVKPDLLFISVLFFGYSFGSLYGEVTGFVGGLFLDSISRAPLGFNTLPKVILGYAIGFFGRSMFHGSMISVVVIIIIASLIKGVLSLILAFIFHKAAMSDVIRIIIPETFNNAIWGPVLFFIYDKIFNFELSKERY